MKIIIIRHADPDFAHSSITKAGMKEVKALADYYKEKDFDYIYCSPLNRAKLTAQAVIKKKTIHYVNYLKEFLHPFPYKGDLHHNWDFLPSELITDFKDLYNPDKYLDNRYLKQVNMKENYNNVVRQFDETLKKHGYQRIDKGVYKVLKRNKDTIVFFCHFGMMSVLLSRLTNIPFVILAQYFCCLPTGVTILNTEERKEGIAQFRIETYGDLTHLKIKNITPSFSARFCELYTDNTRHE